MTVLLKHMLALLYATLILLSHISFASNLNAQREIQYGVWCVGLAVRLFDLKCCQI